MRDAWFRAACAVIALALLTLLFAAPHRTPGMEGEVRCVDGIPVPIAPMPNLRGEQRWENVRHEAIHIAQFAVGCDSVAQLWRDDPEFRLELEAQATCAGLTVYWDTTGQSVRKAERVVRIAQTYLQSKGNTVGFEDIWDAIDRWCPQS